MSEIRNSCNTSRTINRQQQYTEQDYHYDNNIITTQTRACSKELPGDEVMEKIAEAYRANINPMITQVAAQIIEKALSSDMEPGTVILAIEETGMASRPSPYYLAAVLRNWAQSGVVLRRAHGGAEVSTTRARPWWR